MPSFEQVFMPEYTEQRLRLLRVSAQAAESLAKGKNTTRLWDTAREAIAEYAKTLDIDPEFVTITTANGAWPGRVDIIIDTRISDTVAPNELEDFYKESTQLLNQRAFRDIARRELQTDEPLLPNLDLVKRARALLGRAYDDAMQLYETTEQQWRDARKKVADHARAYGIAPEKLVLVNTASPGVYLSVEHTDSEHIHGRILDDVALLLGHPVFHHLYDRDKDEHGRLPLLPED